MKAKNKVVLVFPGQGSQYVGMGSNLAKHPASALFSRADSILDYPISKLCSLGPLEELTLTQNAQPAILTYSIALYQWLRPILEQNNFEIDLVLGHSVGEYAALVASSVLSFEDACLAAHKRGLYMQAAVPPNVGKMVAIMRADSQIISQTCLEISRPGHFVMPANYNSQEQTVISGHIKACEDLVETLKIKCPEMRAINLQVSAPFHSELLSPASHQLESFFADIEFLPPKINYVANIDAQIYGPSTQTSKIKENLIKQVAGSVLWWQSVEKINPHLPVIEVGPGRVLAGLIGKINRDIRVLSLDNAFNKDLPAEIIVQEWLLA